MRCLSCNCELSDFEATRKFSNSLEYVDLCNSCFFLSGISVDDTIDRADLSNEYMAVEGDIGENLV